MDNLYLVVGTVRVSGYMDDKDRRERVIRLVRAESADDAEAKYRSRLENHDPYGEFRSVENVEVSGVIE